MNVRLITELDALEEQECIDRGCLINAHVETPNGVYTLYFTDPVRLQQDIQEELDQGNSHFAEPGLVIIPMVTIENINIAVKKLFNEGFFSNLVPVDRQ